MESKEALDQGLVDLLKNAAREGSELESLVSDLNNAFDTMYGPYRAQQYATINAKYTTVMSKLEKVIRQSQNALSALEGNQISPARSPVQTEEVSTRTPSPPPQPKEPPLHIHRPHHMFELFLSREMPLCDMPYPPLCGNLPPDENEKIPLDSFVAVKLDTDYVLCYVAGYDGDDYIICDADADDPVPIKKDKSLLIQLPTSLPRTKNARLAYPVGTNVLSLWPVSDDDWTSAFYAATVAKVPSKDGTVYELKFENDGTYDKVSVPENFVVAMPKLE